MPHAASKICATCGRRFEWRRKWADVWEEVRYCSASCRSGPGRTGRALEDAIVRLLADRSPNATLCPSEAARAVFGDDAWRPRMEEARRAGRRLAAAGRIEVLQAGRAVDPTDAKGPIRYRSAVSPSGRAP